MKKNVLVLILIIITNSLLGQTEKPFGGLHKRYKKYLSNIPDTVLADFYFKGATSKKIIAITFDDGPFRNTSTIIPFLAKENIPAIFFSS